MTRNDTHRYLVAYDIPVDQRRDRLAKCLQHHGDRVQYSVFVLDISPARLLRLKTQLNQIIDVGQDSLLICDLGLARHCADGRFEYLGQSRPTTGVDSLII
jgi:CRISPR-associated protein Cas2